MPPPARSARYHSQPTLEGAGVRLKRVFGFGDPALFDRFCCWTISAATTPPITGRLPLASTPRHRNHHLRAGRPGRARRFPGQPRRDPPRRSAVDDRRQRRLPPGDARRRRARRMYGFQLWANLPAAYKMMDPRYRGVTSPRSRQSAGARRRGAHRGRQLGEVSGPVRDVVIDPQYLDVTLPPGAEWLHPTPTTTPLSRTSLAAGRLRPRPGLPGLVGKRPPGALQSRRAGPGPGRSEGARFLFIAGRPLHEPVAWYGPIVMNTQAELQTAVRELQEGTFIKTA